LGCLWYVNGKPNTAYCNPPQPTGGPHFPLMIGYIKLFRKAIENGWLSNHKLWTFWCFCLMKASHRSHTQRLGFQEIPLKPGQFIFGRKSAAEDLNMSEQSIRTCLATLKKSKNLTTKSTNKFTIVSVCNWEQYQVHDGEINQPTNQQLTTNNNEKNILDRVLKEKIYKKEIKGDLLNGFQLRFPSIECAAELQRFISYCQQNGKTYKNAAAAFNSWLLSPYEKIPRQDQRAEDTLQYQEQIDREYEADPAGPEFRSQFLETCSNLGNKYNANKSDLN